MVSLKFLFAGDNLRWTKAGSSKQFSTPYSLVRLFVAADPRAVTRSQSVQLAALKAACNPWSVDN